jgi:Xaa-Pro aminopeptidase
MSWDPMLADRLPELLDRHGLSAWLIFTRESTPDPLASRFGAGEAVGRTACLFGRCDGRFRRVALCASFDVSPLEACGLYDEIVPHRSEGVRPHLADWLPRFGPGPVGINESRDIPVADGLASGMRAYLVEAVGDEQARRLTGAEGLVADLLGTRSPDELAAIEAVVLRTQEVLLAAFSGAHVRPGVTTEREFAATITQLTEEAGDRVEFLSVNVGPTRGHSEPTDRVIEPGDLLRVDFGIRRGAHCSDIQRTAWVRDGGSEEPPPAIRRMWEVNRSAFAAALEAMRPGARGLDVDAAARGVIEAAGYEGYPHAAGHPVGRLVHDVGPILGPDWPDRYGTSVHLRLGPDQVYAVEPIVYAEDPRTGDTIHVGLEHDVVVTADGCRLIGEDQPELWLI